MSPRTPIEAAIELAVALERCPRQRHSHKTTLELTPEVERSLDVFLFEFAGAT